MKSAPQRPLLLATAVLGLSAICLTWAVAQDALAPTDAAGESPLLSEPRDDGERLEASLLMLRLGRDGLARRYVGQILDGDATDEELLELRDRFGPGAFVTLSRAEGLEPLGDRLLDRVERAFRDSESDETRINRLIALLDAKAVEADQAADALASGGAATAPTLVNALYEPPSDVREDRLIDVLAEIGEPARRPVEIATRAERTDFVGRLIVVLGRLDPRPSRAVLLALAADPARPAGTRRLAAETLGLTGEGDVDRHAIADELAAAALERQAASLSLEDARSTAYLWDDGRRRLVTEEANEADVAIGRAERFIDAAGRIAPANARIRPAAIAVTARRATFDASGGDVPATALLTEGLEALTQASETAASFGDSVSASLALKAAGRLLTAGSVLAPAGDRVIDALDSADPLLRLTAAEALVAAAPSRGHRNASAVPRVFARGLAAGEGVAVVIDGDPSRASLVAGYFNELGYVADLRRDGRAGFEAAAAENFTDVIAVHFGVARPDLRSLVNALRADARTRRTPIVIYGDDIFRDRLERLAGRFPECEFVQLTPVRDAFLRQVRPLVRGGDGRPVASVADEDAYRRRCLAGLRAIAERGSTSAYPLDGLVGPLESALVNPALEADAAATLGMIPEANAQRALAEHVLRRREPVAAEALVGHVRRYGTLLPPAMVESLVTLAGDPETPSALRDSLAAFRGMLVTRLSR